MQSILDCSELKDGDINFIYETIEKIFNFANQYHKYSVQKIKIFLK